MINVTKSFLPPIEEYKRLIDRIFESNWLTNYGPLANELEEKIGKYLNVTKPLFLTNGTIALQIAIKALGKTGKILTTPFSYVATTSSIVWENCEPVFVDIDPNTFNIDPALIEEAITNDTIAILATHVFGNACDIEAIDVIAKKYGLLVIYDGAHCFGTKYKGESVYKYGDVSTCSFHATKIFQTIEGGAVFSENNELIRKMSLLRNFGHTSPVSFDGIGINGKNSEFHAAMGLCNLNYIDEILQKRKEQWTFYYNELIDNYQLLQITKGCEFNYSYFPVIFKTESELQGVCERLNRAEIFPRRYFYPSLNLLDYVKRKDCPVSEKIASSVLCLPIYHTLTLEEQIMICHIIRN